MSARIGIAALLAVSLSTTGCVSFDIGGGTVSSRAIDPSFSSDAFMQRTSSESAGFDNDAHAQAPAPAPASAPAAPAPAAPNAGAGTPGTNVSSTPNGPPTQPNSELPTGSTVGNTTPTAPGAIPSGPPVSKEQAMQPGPEVRKPVQADPGTERQQRVRKGFFWAGVALTIIGGATLLATGIGGRVTQGQLTKGYDEESLTHSREKTLRDRGDVFNALAGAGGGVLAVGAGVTAITFGIDYSRCGSIAKRKRKDCKR